MNSLDIALAVCAAGAALAMLVVSPWYRAVVTECLLHPLSSGWVEAEGGRVAVHRGVSLSEHLLSQTPASPEEDHTAPETRPGVAAGAAGFFGQGSGKPPSGVGA